jgi:ribose transport system permease protein
MTVQTLSVPHAIANRLTVGLRYRFPARFLISWIALLGVCLVAAVVAPSTFSGVSITLVTGLAGCLLVASLGLQLVVMQGALDLSVQGHITLSAAVTLYYLDSLGSIMAVVVALGLCMAISLITGSLITLFRLNALIVTLAVNTIILAAITVWMGQTFSRTGEAPRWLISLSLQSFLGINAIMYVALALAILLAALVGMTRAGRRYVATGNNPRAATMLGLNGNVLAIGGFALAGLFYALAGVLLSGLVQTPGIEVGLPYMLTTIVAVALAGALFNGGPASVSSLVAACLVLQILSQTLSIQELSDGVQAVVQGAILAIAVSLSTILKLSRQGWARARGRLTRVR